MTPQGQKCLKGILTQLESRGESELLEGLWRADYERVPVTPREFFTHPDYLGFALGPDSEEDRKGLHEKWLRELDVVLSTDQPKAEWILKGALGTGKTTCSTAAQVYKLYCLTCLKDPASFYQLLPGSKIVFYFFSITLDKADAGYDLMKYWLDRSTYFREFHPRLVKRNDPISLPSKRIEIHIGSLSEHALGEHVFGFSLDEANFFKGPGHRAVTASEKSRAHAIYTAAKRRQESRFMRFGHVPGLNCLISSQRTQTHFLEERVRKSAHDPTVHVTQFALWDVKPASNYCGDSFRVMIGDGSHASRVLEDDELPAPGCSVVEVPVEHRTSFEEDTDEALRDLAGKAVTGEGYFFALRERILSCVDRSRSHPFTKVEITELSSEDPDANLFSYIVPELLFRIEKGRSVPILDPTSSRAVHIDIGLTGDALGFAVGHLNRVGTLIYDILLRIRPPTVGEVHLDAIVQFLRDLRQHGMRIRKVSYDRYQSKQSIQQLKRAGFDGTTLSIGLREMKVLRQRIYAGPYSCSYYYYEPFIIEAQEERKDPGGGDPDHPEKGSDDVLEAAAGVATHFSSVLSTPSRSSVSREIENRARLPVIGGGLPGGFWGRGR